MSTYGWLSIVPPILAIVMALRTRQVHLSLFAGIWIGATILAGFNPLAGVAAAIEQLVGVISDAGNARTLMFTLMVGALIVLLRESGGVAGFAEWAIARGWVRGKRSAQLISAFLGISIFIESNITCLVTGTVSRPLYDRVGLSRAKLAYVCDSTSAPICMLIPINAWGALIISLLAAEGLADPLGVLIAAIPLNFYALLALGTVFLVALSGRDYGPMARAEAAAAEGAVRVDAPAIDLGEGAPEEGKKARNLVVPVVVTVAMVPVVLYITGNGEWLQGSASTAVLLATVERRAGSDAAVSGTATVLVRRDDRFGHARLSGAGASSGDPGAGARNRRDMPCARHRTVGSVDRCATADPGHRGAGGVHYRVRHRVLYRQLVGYLRHPHPDRRSSGAAERLFAAASRRRQ